MFILLFGELFGDRSERFQSKDVVQRCHGKGNVLFLAVIVFVFQKVHLFIDGLQFMQQFRAGTGEDDALCTALEQLDAMFNLGWQDMEDRKEDIIKFLSE